MKKFIIFLILSCLFFNINSNFAMAETKQLKQGFYKANELNLPLQTTHTIQNNSFSDRVLIIVLDSNQIIRQVLRLTPQSEKYKLIPLDEGYTIIITGDGEITIT